MSAPAMSIGEVLSALRGEFPDISVSKIRFLESEGLLEPERTPAGYRKFKAGDLERLRVILRLQRDSFLPLKVIRKRLIEADTRGADPSSILVDPATVAASDAHEPFASVDFDQALPRRTWTDGDLAHEIGISRALVEQLVKEGLLCRHRIDGQDVFDADDVPVAEAAKQLVSAGFDIRGLRTLKRTAQQEAEMLEGLGQAALLNPNAQARKAGIEALVAMRDASAALRTALIRKRLRELLARTAK